MKGANAGAELEDATKALALLGGSTPNTFTVQLPEREMLHYLLRIEKESATPNKYPRRVGKPSKKPL
ncbi:MAG: 16S rRNA (guanine(527)-N(7))-methyltransferase RsmG, partial [Candidatus Promineifilaceae bacterium]